MVLNLLDKLINTALLSGFEVTRIGEVEAYPIVSFTRDAGEEAPTVLVSAGIHGDEPAPVHAIQSLLQSESLDDSFSWIVLPLINPTGLEKGTRENHAGRDLNRDFLSLESEEIQAYVKFLGTTDSIDLSIALHEDWESTGFYTYALGGSDATSLARSAIDAVSKFALIETSTHIDDFPAKNGLITPEDHTPIADREEWPEAIYLNQRKNALSLTLETPSSLPLDERIPMHIAAFESVLRAFRQLKG